MHFLTSQEVQQNSIYNNAIVVGGGGGGRGETDRKKTMEEKILDSSVEVDLMID